MTGGAELCVLVSEERVKELFDCFEPAGAWLVGAARAWINARICNRPIRF